MFVSCGFGSYIDDSKTWDLLLRDMMLFFLIHREDNLDISFRSDFLLWRNYWCCAIVERQG